MNCINNYRDIFEECLTGCKESALVHEPLQMIYTVLVDEALTSFASGQNVRIDAKYECMSGTSIVPCSSIRTLLHLLHANLCDTEIGWFFSLPNRNLSSSSNRDSSSYFYFRFFRIPTYLPTNLPKVGNMSITTRWSSLIRHKFLMGIVPFDCVHHRRPSRERERGTTFTSSKRFNLILWRRKCRS